MDNRESKRFDDMDIKIPIGNVIVNILNLSYESPRPAWFYRNHTHSGFELHVVPEGKGNLRVFGKNYSITAGTFYITGPGVYHEQTADRFDPMCEYCMNFEIKVLAKSKQKNCTYIPSEIDNMFKVLTNTGFWFGKDEYSNIDLFKRMMLELEKSHIGYYTYAQSLGMQIIVNAIRSFTAEKESHYMLPHKIPNDARRVLVDTYFTDCDKPLNREELADRIGVTIRHLNRIMQEYYSMSFQEKLIITRLEGARSLLVNSGLSIKEIAEQTGFSSVSYFSRVFRKHYHVSPSAFREQK